MATDRSFAAFRRARCIRRLGERALSGHSEPTAPRGALPRTDRRVLPEYVARNTAKGQERGTQVSTGPDAIASVLGVKLAANVLRQPGSPARTRQLTSQASGKVSPCHRCPMLIRRVLSADPVAACARWPSSPRRGHRRALMTTAVAGCTTAAGDTAAGDSAGIPSVQARQSDALTDSFGIKVETSSSAGMYGQRARAESELKSLGVRHIRTDFFDDNEGQYAYLNKLHADLGITALLTMGRPDGRGGTVSQLVHDRLHQGFVGSLRLRGRERVGHPRRPELGRRGAHPPGKAVCGRQGKLEGEEPAGVRPVDGSRYDLLGAWRRQCLDGLRQPAHVSGWATAVGQPRHAIGSQCREPQIQAGGEHRNRLPQPAPDERRPPPGQRGSSRHLLSPAAARGHPLRDGPHVWLRAD